MISMEVCLEECQEERLKELVEENRFGSRSAILRRALRAYLKMEGLEK